MNEEKRNDCILMIECIEHWADTIKKLAENEVQGKDPIDVMGVGFIEQDAGIILKLTEEIKKVLKEDTEK